MGTLYNISEEYRAVFSQIDMLSDIEDDDARAEMEQAIIDTLEGMEGEFADKIESCACFVKGLDADADAIATEIKILQERKRAKEAHSDRLRRYMMDAMQRCGEMKIDRPRAVVSIRKGVDKVRFISNGCTLSDTEFIEWAESNNCTEFISYKPSISRTAVKKAIEDGAEGIPAEIVKEPILSIK